MPNAAYRYAEPAASHYIRRMNFDLVSKLYSLPAIVIGLTIHEFMHAFASYSLGDATAKEQGRLSLNPLKHLDPLGMAFIIIAGFGWAKPVVFDKARLKSPRRDEAIIAAAGPLSNFALGIVGTLLLKLLTALDPNAAGAAYAVMANSLFYLIFINLGLFIFNAIPIPPLDGSHVLFCWLKIKQSTEERLYKLGMPLLFGILLLENFTRIDILPIGKAVRLLAQFFFKVVGL